MVPVRVTDQQPPAKRSLASPHQCGAEGSRTGAAIDYDVTAVAGVNLDA